MLKHSSVRHTLINSVTDPSTLNTHTKFLTRINETQNLMIDTSNNLLFMKLDQEVAEIREISMPVHDCQKKRTKKQARRCLWCNSSETTQSLAVMDVLSCLVFLCPYVFRRDGEGVRVFWDRLREPTFTSRWNPFATDFPFITFISHPVRNFNDAFAALCNVRGPSQRWRPSVMAVQLLTKNMESSCSPYFHTALVIDYSTFQRQNIQLIILQEWWFHIFFCQGL